MATGYVRKRPLRDVADKIKWCDRRNSYRQALQKGVLQKASYEKVKHYMLEDFCRVHNIEVKPPSPDAPKVNTLDNYSSGKAAQDSLLEST
jgi:hypothetical protein